MAEASSSVLVTGPILVCMERRRLKSIPARYYDNSETLNSKLRSGMSI